VASDYHVIKISFTFGSRYLPPIVPAAVVRTEVALNGFSPLGGGGDHTTVAPFEVSVKSKSNLSYAFLMAARKSARVHG
jgi:hypothetical protein